MTRGVLLCACGNEFEATLRSVERENLGCGCRLKRGSPKHGHASRQVTSSTYSSWKAAKMRCYNPKHKRYKFYGAVGVTMCDKWLHSFESFLKDMGERPVGHTLDRFPDTKGNYEPGNCRWATIDQQARNTSKNILITFNGKTMILIDWSRETGIHRNTLRERYNRGWGVPDMLTPVKT